MAKTIAGLYNSFEDAREVRDALVNAGFSRSDISILAANSEDRQTAEDPPRVSVIDIVATVTGCSANVASNTVQKLAEA